MASPLPRKIWVPVASAVALVGAYAVAGYQLAPRLLADALRSHVEGRLGLQLALGDVEVAPFAWSARISDFAITAPHGVGPAGSGAAPLVAFASLTVDLSATSLWRRSLVIEELAVTAPVVSAVLDQDRRLNLMALLPSDPPTPGDAASPPTEPLPAVELRELRVDGGSATFEDRGQSPVLRLAFAPIRFALRDFSTRRDAANRYRLQARAATGESLEWQGSFELQPFAARGDFRLNGLSSRTLARHAASLMPFELGDGHMRLVARYDVAAGGEAGLAARVMVDTLDVANLALAERSTSEGAGAPVLRIAGLAVRDASIDVGARRIDLGRIGVQGLRVDAVRDAAGLNLQRLWRRDAADDSPPTWSVAVPRIAIVDSALRFEDRTRSPAAVLPLESLTVVATGFDSATASEVGLRINGQLADGSFGLDAAVALRPEAPPTLSGQASIEGFDLLTLVPYLSERVRLDLRSGRFDANGAIELDAEQRLAFAGRVVVREFRAQDRSVRRDLIKWRRLAFDGVRLQGSLLGRGSVRIASVEALAPYVDLVIGPDGSTNLADVLSGDAPRAEPSDAAPQPPAFAVAIDEVRMRDGSANFADLSVTPNFGTGIQTLSGTITGLSSAADSRAKVTLAGEVDRYAPVSIDGEINYLAARSYTDLKVVFSNMELTTLNPYSGKFAGYRIERGKLSADFAYRVADRKLDAKHKILLTQLQLGERVESEDAVGLPLKLAIALLKDRNGNIELDLPVSGSLDDPQFRVGPIVWKMFVNLIGKIVTAPFALLGSLFGGGEDSRFVEFAPGSAVLTAAMQQRLDGVRSALIDRPELRLELPLATDAALDGEVLRDLAWRRELEQFAPQALRADRGRYLKALTSRYTASGADPAPLLESLEAADRNALRELSIGTLEQALRAAIVVTAADYEALARARAAAVQDALLQSGEIDPVRVFVTRPAPASAEGDAVRLELALSVD